MERIWFWSKCVVSCRLVSLFLLLSKKKEKERQKNDLQSRHFCPPFSSRFKMSEFEGETETPERFSCKNKLYKPVLAGLMITSLWARWEMCFKIVTYFYVTKYKNKQNKTKNINISLLYIFRSFFFQKKCTHHTHLFSLSAW